MPVPFRRESSEYLKICKVYWSDPEKNNDCAVAVLATHKKSHDADEESKAAETGQIPRDAEPVGQPEVPASTMSAETLIPELKWQRTSDLIVAQSANALVLERLEQLTNKVVSNLYACWVQI